MYGTLVNVTALAAASRRVTNDPETFGAIWRSKQLEYSFLSTILCRYRTFWDLTGRALDYAAAHTGTKVTPAARKRLMEAWLKPTPFPDTRESLQRLGTVHSLGILSNGTPRMLREGLKHTQLASCFTSVLSANAVKAFKPAAAVYRSAADALALAPSSILFVSSNGFDVIGAGRFGFKVCWINRRKGLLDPLGYRPNLEVETLSQLADRLCP